MGEVKQVLGVEVERLIGHPGNPNRMSGGVFKKLMGHIKRTGNYEPAVVRRHPEREGCFEILNGHHRVKALRQLGYEKVDCVVWDVDDDEALILLGTLNRLSGGDEVYRKSELIKKLSRSFGAKQLAMMLPDSAKTIERLKNLMAPAVLPKVKAFLNPLVFFVTDEQKMIVDEAIASAVDPGMQGTTAQKRAWAVVEILREAKRL